MIPAIFIVDDEAPARSRMRTLLSDIAVHCPTRVVGESDHAQAALDGIAASRPDIVLLDVQMSGMNGIELAQHMLQNSSTGKEPTIIFVSAHDTYALKAFEVHAFDYLLKPVRAQRLEEAILRAVRLREKLNEAAETSPDQSAEDAPVTSLLSSQRQFFSVMERGRILLVPVSDVVYIKAEQKYLTLHTVQQQYLIEESLQAIEIELPGVFVRIHRNTLIARSALAGVERGMELDEQTGKMSEAWLVLLRDCRDRLPISRRLWPTIKAMVK